MIIIYIIFIILLFLGLKNRKYNNPYKLYMVFGKKGSGKSSYLCKMAIKYQKKGYTIYTNMKDIMLNGVRIIDAENIGKFVPPPKSCILIDESGMIYDNRSYKNFTADTRDFYKLQRHYNCVVFLASQTFDIDKKLRDLTDRMYLVNNILPYLSIVRPITKKIALVEANATGESRIAENLKFQLFTNWRFIYLPKYAKYFDSFTAPQKPEIAYELIKNDSDEKKVTIRARVYRVREMLKRKRKKDKIHS